MPQIRYVDGEGGATPRDPGPYVQMKEPAPGTGYNRRDFLATAYTAIRVLETCTLAAMPAVLKFGEGIFKFGRSGEADFNRATRKYPYRYSTITISDLDKPETGHSIEREVDKNDETRPHFESVGVGINTQSILADKTFLLGKIARCDLVLLGGAIEPSVRAELRSIGSRYNRRFIDIDPFSQQAKKIFDWSVTLTSFAVAAALLYGNLKAPVFPIVGGNSDFNPLRFGRRMLLRMAAAASFFVGDPSLKRFGASTSPETYPEFRVSYPADYQTVWMYEYVKNLLSIDSNKKILIITPEPHVAGFEYYAKHAQELQRRSSIYEHTYGRLLAR